MEEVIKTISDHRQHSFSYPDELFDICRDHEETTDFNINAVYDRISPSADQVFVPYCDIDTKWRSISVLSPSQLFNRSERANDHVEINNLVNAIAPKGLRNSAPDYIQLQTSVVLGHINTAELICKNSQKLSSEIKVPDEPFLLFLSHFETCVPLTKVTDLIEKTLGHFAEISYEFVAEECMWNALYLSGSVHCKIQINVYNRGTSHIVEGNRLSGDSATFRSVFNELKATMQTAYSEGKSPDCVTYNCSLPVSDLLSDIESRKALMPVLQMAKSGKVESQLEASRLMCDLSLHDDMQQLLCDSGCLKSLVEDLLPLQNCEWTHQHALIALANLSEAPSCQGAMIDAGVLPALLSLATDGPYHTAEIGRESARILANLSSCMAARVVHVLGPRAVTKWMGSVDLIRDERLRLHASRAKNFLSVAAV